MSATLYFQEWNGEDGVEVATSKESEEIQFSSVDSPVVESYEEAANPLSKPNSGVNRSCEKWLRVYLEALNDVDEVSNLQVFMSGEGSPSGVAVFAKTAEDYATPLLGGRTGGGAMVGPKANLYSFTAAEPLELGEGPFDTEAASIGDFLVLQMEIYPSASIGATPNRSLILRWDEE